MTAKRSTRRGLLVAIAVAAAFMAAVVATFGMLAVREYRIARNIRDSVVWATLQFNREAMRFAMTLRASEPSDHAAEIRRQFDILFSKIDILKSPSFAINLRADEALTASVAVAAEEIDAVAAILDANPGPIGAPNMAKILLASDALVTRSNEISLRTNSLNVEGVTSEREYAIRLYWMLAGCVASLGAVGLIIIRVLFRQIAALDLSRREAEGLSAELTIKAEEAVAGSRAKSQFLATMSHEIRTPMNGVIAAAELLRTTRLDDEQADLARTIGSCGEALLAIINDILDYSKLEAGKLAIDSTGFDLADAIESVLAIVRPNAAEKKLRLAVEIAPETPRRLVGDVARLRQILLNLVGNGVKFTESGGVRVTAKVDATQAPARLRLEVIDTGMGIAREALGGLFVEFNQLEASMARRFGGTGLGLAISKRLVDLLAGEIGVDSVVGLGTRFWLELPVGIQPADAPTESDLKVEPAAGRRLRILVTDDSRVNRHVVGKLLARMGHEVAFAADGREAVAAVAAERFDLIFMDLQMPDMDGLAAAQAIRALGGVAGATPVAALTANVSDEDRAACLKAGMNAFAAKPISADRLRAVIAELFGPDVAPGQAPLCFDAAARDALSAELGDDGLAELDAQFAIDLASISADVTAALASRDVKALRAVLHTLRGAAANLGVSTLVDLSESLKAEAVERGLGDNCDKAGAALLAACATLQTAGASRCAAKAA